MKWFGNKEASKGKGKKGDAGEGTVRVSDFLSEKRILFFHAGQSKQQVLGSLIAALDLADPNAALKAILAREEVGTTVVSKGLALPHARIPGIRRLRAAVGISPQGVVADHKTNPDPIHVFVLFLGPADNMKEHLGFLAAVSNLFQQEGFQDALLSQKASAEALRFIAAREGE